MNKKLLIGVIVVVVILLGWWMFGSRGQAPVTQTTDNATADTYTQELDGLNSVDINSELQGVDADINQL
jgi:hypothetical protein